MQFYLGAAGLRRAPCLSTSGVAAHALLIQRPKNGMHSATIEEAEQPQLRKAQVLLVGPWAHKHGQASPQMQACGFCHARLALLALFLSKRLLVI